MGGPSESIESCKFRIKNANFDNTIMGRPSESIKNCEFQLKTETRFAEFLMLLEGLSIVVMLKSEQIGFTLSTVFTKSGLTSPLGELGFRFRASPCSLPPALRTDLGSPGGTKCQSASPTRYPLQVRRRAARRRTSPGQRVHKTQNFAGEKSS